MTVHRESHRRCGSDVRIRSIENSELLSPLRLVVDCEMKCHIYLQFSYLLFGFAVAVEDRAYEHGQDGVDEPDECDGKGYAGCVGAEDTEDDERPSATDGNISCRYGWEDCHHHVVEWDGDHVLHEGHVHAAEV